MSLENFKKKKHEFKSTFKKLIKYKIQMVVKIGK